MFAKKTLKGSDTYHTGYINVRKTVVRLQICVLTVVKKYNFHDSTWYNLVSLGIE